MLDAETFDGTFLSLRFESRTCRISWTCRSPLFALNLEMSLSENDDAIVISIVLLDASLAR